MGNGLWSVKKSWTLFLRENKPEAVALSVTDHLNNVCKISRNNHNKRLLILILCGRDPFRDMQMRISVTNKEEKTTATYVQFSGDKCTQ
jgi:hypothetical protein